ncbi:hypothetical protein C7M46_00077 [Pediococcus pentosaceus]|uniref:DNA/RNA non-specific endonuclease n=1 Tax=Pediococcus pentosaceus TaxID=1255 RepID=UPI001363C75A|nr:DNA/RNA non-specific endonuclease [Pediococcus pentosaceus]QHM59434.1 hypothetical protein C7M46_00077 [Pediococcus pentosaceus]
MKKLSTLGLIALSAFTIVTGSSTIFPGITTRTVSASTKIIKKDTIKKSHKAILKKLVTYDQKESAGPTGDYYWDNGKAELVGFKHMKAGNYHFSSDKIGRSATAKAILTYTEYKNSKGSRQSEPLDPPAWPITNDKVAIEYKLTSRTYHGYLYNRSHSIGDSLLGKDSYDSEYNFTTGTRPQNVGATQNGGMRHAEETVEKYWESHSNTKNTISYETTPLYKGNEKIPRGSVVDIKSSDGSLNKEIVVINSVEGTKIKYLTGTVISTLKSTKSSQSSESSTKENSEVQSSIKSSEAPSTSSEDTPTAPTSDAGGWTTAPAGKVFVSNSEKYYTRVKNPGNYELTTQSDAQAEGATQAIRGNQYAQP